MKQCSNIAMKKGFTLVELLIVMAILGILASLILAVLGGSEEKARDTRIKVELNQLRNVAGMIKIDDKDYDRLCIDKPSPDCASDVLLLRDDIAVQGGELIINKTTPALYYAAYSKLNVKKDGNTVYFCVDSYGMAKETTTEPVGATQCP